MPRRMAEGIELLADPTRRRIVALIAGRIWHPADIAQALELFEIASMYRTTSQLNSQVR